MRFIRIGFVLAIVFFAFRNPTAALTAEDRTAPMTLSEETLATALVEQSTVRVVARGCDGVIRGSGFGASGILFTNKHLTLGSDQIKVDQSGTPVIRPVLGRSERLDIATAAPIAVRELDLATQGPEPGEPLLLGGHAGGGDLVIIAGVAKAEVDGESYGIDGRLLLIDAVTTGGFSGGPVVNRNGDVVAMLQGFDHVTGLTLAVPVEALSAPAGANGNIGAGLCG